MEDLKFKILCELGENYLKLGKTKEAKINFEKAIEENNNSEIPYIGLAKIFLKNNNLKKAEEYVEKARQINPENIAITSLLAEINYLQKNFENSYNLSIQALEKDLENFDSLLILLKSSYRLQRFEDLEKYLKIFHNKYPSDLNLIYALCGCLYMEDKLEEAKRYLEKLLAIDRENSKAKDLLQLINKKVEVVKEVENEVY